MLFVVRFAARLEEELRKKQEAEEAAQAKEKERKRLQKQGAGSKKLSFVMDVSLGVACSSCEFSVIPNQPCSVINGCLYHVLCTGYQGVIYCELSIRTSEYEYNYYDE